VNIRAWLVDRHLFNALMSNGSTVIGVLTVGGWAITFGTARRRLGGAQGGDWVGCGPAQSPPRCT